MLAARRVPPPMWNLKLGNPCVSVMHADDPPAHLLSLNTSPSTWTLPGIDLVNWRRLWERLVRWIHGFYRLQFTSTIDDPSTLAGLDPTRIHCNLGGFDIYIKLMEKAWKISSARLETRLQQQPSRAAYKTGRTSALRTLPTATRNSSRRSLRWKDAKLSWPQAAKISADSNGWISLGDSRTEALSESDGTPRDFGKLIPEVDSDINSKIPPVKTCGIQSRTTSLNLS
jgi:hypothetical protein